MTGTEGNPTMHRLMLILQVVLLGATAQAADLGGRWVRFEWRHPKSFGDMQRKFWAGRLDQVAVTLTPLKHTDRQLVTKCAVILPGRATVFKLSLANGGDKPVIFKQVLPTVLIVLKDGTKVPNVNPFGKFGRHYVREKKEQAVAELFKDLQVQPKAIAHTLVAFPKRIAILSVKEVYYGVTNPVKLDTYVFPKSSDLAAYAVMMPEGM